MAAKFLQFKYLEPSGDRSKKLKSQFLSDQTNDKFIKMYKSMKKNEQGGLFINFYYCEIENLYVVMIKGSNDWLLMKLGKEHEMPRGFPILWIPTRLTRYFGFLPKFANDDRQIVDKLDDFKQTESLRFFKKWSGFLAQLLVFEIDDVKYFTVCSKNSIGYDSDFVKDAKRLFEPFLTDELVDRMITNKIHICAEIMSKNDQTHGAKVLTETPVVTVIGEMVGESSDKFVKFFTHKEVVDFCVKYKLPCDSAVIVNGNKSCLNFLEKLFNERDFADNALLERLIQEIAKQNSVSVQKGTVSHSDILGNRLEGIVFSIVNKDGTEVTRKYKFPGYTIRTMLFRPEMQNFMFGMHLKKKITRFVDFWCVSEPGKKYWYEKGLQGFLSIYEGKLNDIKVENIGDRIGDHITLCDYLDSHDYKDVTTQFDIVASSLIQGTVIVVVGPIGSGKTTIGDLICGKNAKQCELVHIDGDNLGIGNDLTLNLKSERNPFSLWKVIETLMKGKIPVLSTGGGILFNKTDCILRETIHKVLGISVDLIVFVASGSHTKCIKSVKSDTTKFLSTTYGNFETVKKTIKSRVDNRSWTVPDSYKTKKDASGIDGFSTFIFGKSKENQKFCERLVDESDSLYVFPVITEKEYKSHVLNVKKFLDSDLQIHLNENQQSKKKDGKFSQIRILVEIIEKGVRTFVGHITYKYDSSRNIEMSIDDFYSLIKPGSYEGLRYDLVSLDGKSKISLAVPNKSVHEDGRSHVTINNGIHEAKEMATVAKAIYNGSNQILINDENQLTYTLTEGTKCQMNYVAVFGI